MSKVSMCPSPLHPYPQPNTGYGPKDDTGDQPGIHPVHGDLKKKGRSSECAVRPDDA
jgi:hypothetical protein